MKLKALLAGMIVFTLFFYATHEGFIWCYRQIYDHRIDRSWGYLLEGAFYLLTVLSTLSYGFYIQKKNRLLYSLLLSNGCLLVAFLLFFMNIYPYRSLLFVTVFLSAYACGGVVVRKKLESLEK